MDENATKANFNAQSALGYIGQVEDVASLVSYIASKESHFITGQAVSFRHHCDCLLNFVETKFFDRYLRTVECILNKDFCSWLYLLYL